MLKNIYIYILIYFKIKKYFLKIRVIIERWYGGLKSEAVVWCELKN